MASRVPKHLLHASGTSVVICLLIVASPSCIRVEGGPGAPEGDTSTPDASAADGSIAPTVVDAAVVDAPAVDAAGGDTGAALRASAAVYSANGHAYLVVCNGSTNWSVARDAAQKAGGYLATLTSQEENDFVGALVAKPLRPECWNGTDGPWLGAQRIKPSGSDAWQWLTGESWSDGKAEWHPNQPDNQNGEESALQCYEFKGRLTWNDAKPTRDIPGYVIEWDPT
jgi:hypothetical protein